MKKLLIFLFMFLLLGCNNINTPKKEVEKLFVNYNSLSSELLKELDNVIDYEMITDYQKEEYKDILKKQYEDLKYNIINESIDNNTAVVTVEIEVYDFKNVIDDIDTESKNEFYIDGIFNKEEFWNYKLDKLKTQTNRIKYTLDLSLTKIDDKWVLNNLLENDRKKIHGLY